VVDEYGDILGLLTREDVLTLIAGELSSAAKEHHGGILEEDDGALLIPGHIGVRTLNRRLGWHLPTGGPRTLNGLVLEQLEALPREGTQLAIGGHSAEIVETNASGVALLRFEKRKKRKEHHE
ncbi:MAG: transporter associated domain-containing protein, partial [Gammaproteobacteria bacterium]